jgi:hypothetical protein
MPVFFVLFPDIDLCLEVKKCRDCFLYGNFHTTSNVFPPYLVLECDILVCFCYTHIYSTLHPSTTFTFVAVTLFLMAPKRLLVLPALVLPASTCSQRQGSWSLTLPTLICSNNVGPLKASFGML